MSFSAALPSGMENRGVHGWFIGDNVRLLAGETNNHTVHLKFPLPLGCVTSLKQMSFAPTPEKFRGVLVVTIPHTTFDDALSNSL